MTRQWVAAQLRTGQVLEYLPSLVCDWPLRRTIGQFDVASAHLYLTGAPGNWLDATLPGGALLATYDDDDETEAIQWAGYVTKRTRRTDADAVDLELSTAEGYFDRRDVAADLTYTTTGQNAIVAALAGLFIVDGPTPGIPLVISTNGAGAARTISYRDADSATVYQRITELAALQGGPEWTIEWSWSADRLSLVPTLYVGDRIGAAMRTPSPAATFEMPGCVTDATLVEDYSAGKGANNVLALPSTSGNSPGAASSTDFQNRPTFDFRWQPSSSAGDNATLTGYAQRALAQLAPGAIAVTLTAELASAPRCGVDWHLGDDVGYSIGGLDDAGRDIVRAFPGGYAGVARCIGYELGESTISPIIASGQNLP